MKTVATIPAETLAVLIVSCPRCQAENSDGALGCDRCGSALGNVSDVRPPSREDVTASSGFLAYSKTPAAHRLGTPAPAVDSGGSTPLSPTPGSDFGPRYRIECLLGPRRDGTGLQGLRQGVEPRGGAQTGAPRTHQRCLFDAALQAGTPAGEQDLSQEYSPHPRLGRCRGREVHLHGIRGRRGPPSPPCKRKTPAPCSRSTHHPDVAA